MRESVARAAVDALGTAFLSGDPDAVLQHFAGTGEVIYAGSEPGEVAVGKAALRSLLEELFQRDERYSWRTTSVATAGSDHVVHLVTEAILLIHPYRDGAAQSPAEQIPYRIAGVLERETDRWLWRLCQGSEPAQT